MRIRRGIVAVVVGLALSGAGVLDSGARAQSAEGCEAVNDRDEMTVQVGNPMADATFTNASVTLEVQVTNTSTRKTLPTEPDPAVTRITARLLSCRDGQMLPEETTRSTAPGQTADSLALSWPLEPIPTNGPFALEIVATGNRNGSPPQDSRVVVPFSLAVAPKRPTGVKAITTSSGVSVSWSNADREPDLLLYEVQRAPQGSANYTTIEDGVVVATTNTVADNPVPGAWRYRVLAIRRGATQSEGIRSAPSSDGTVEVAAPPPPPPGGSTATTTGSSSGATSTTSGSGSGAGSTGSGASGSDTTVRPGAAGTNTVDLSNFASTLNAQRQAPPRRIEPPDPGFIPTLPFVPRQAVPAPVTDDGLATDAAEPQELGLEEPNQGVGQRVILDEGDRRRSLGFVSFALLLFVLGMIGLFLRSEVRRADDLEPLVPIAPSDPTPAPAPEPEGFADLADPVPVAAAAATASVAGATVPRRARRTAAPSVAPSLDIPEPAATPAKRAPNRSRTPANARRTPTRLPPRPADDRREGDPAVRPRRRRTGEGNRRLPVG